MPQRGYFVSPRDGRTYKYGQQVTIDNKVYQENSDGSRTLIRYSNGTPNYDLTPTGSYITRIENPDSAGYVNGRWYNKAYTDKHKNGPRVWDSNQIGIGIDTRENNNPVVQQYLRNTGQYKYINEDDEHFVRQSTIKEKDDTLNRLMRKYNININLSPNKRAMALGMIYQGLANQLFNPKTPLARQLQNAFTNGTDKQFADSITNFYNVFQNGRFRERAKQNQEYWSTRLYNGGKIRQFQTGGKSPEQSAVNRAQSPYGEYYKAQDVNESIPWYISRAAARYIKDNIASWFPSGVSNCTLTATHWVDPENNLMRAASIWNNPNNYNYSQIPSDIAIPGNLIIAQNPSNKTFHTMMISGFADKDYQYNFHGNKVYPVHKGDILVNYSRGGNNQSDFVNNIPLSVYLDNSEGKNKIRYYRYNYPDSVLLNEIKITPH